MSGHVAAVTRLNSRAVPYFAQSLTAPPGAILAQVKSRLPSRGPSNALLLYRIPYVHHIGYERIVSFSPRPASLTVVRSSVSRALTKTVTVCSYLRAAAFPMIERLCATAVQSCSGVRNTIPTSTHTTLHHTTTRSQPLNPHTALRCPVGPNLNSTCVKAPAPGPSSNTLLPPSDVSPKWLQIFIT